MYRNVRRYLSLMLWSTRISSSRQVVGVETVCANAGNPPLVVLALGINARSADPTAVGVTVSPGNRECVVGLIGQSGKLVVSITPGVAEHRSLKLPPRSASEGTFCGAMVEGFFSRRHSSEKKKKVFFLSEL